MASVYKPTYTKPIPTGAEIFTRKGERFARFKNRKGKTITAPLTEDGTRVRLESAKYVIEYKDANGKPKKAKGYKDKKASDQKAAELEKKAERKEEGLCDPFEEHSKRPLREHLDNYRVALESRDNCPAYVDLTIARLTALFDGCSFQYIRDLDAARVAEWLSDLRRQGKPAKPLVADKKWYTLTEAATVLDMKPGTLSTAVRRNRLAAEGLGRKRRFPRATIEALQERAAQGCSVQTTNYYLSALKSFCRWLVKNKRMGTNPIADAELQGGNERVDRRHDRRELTADELRKVLDAARNSTATFRGLTGADRFHLYATACGTGFRASALASLTPESFNLDADSPTVTLAARHAKNRKTKVQPLPADVADLLRDYLGGKPDGVPVWGGTWASDRRGAEMLRRDLDAAGVPYAVEGPDGPLFADFHALRQHLSNALGTGRRGPADGARTGRPFVARSHGPLLASPLV